MKISQSDLKTLTSLITEVIEQKSIKTMIDYYHSLESDKRINNIETRFVWDTYWYIPSKSRRMFMSVSNGIYNDNHIETALKIVVKKIMGTEYPHKL